MLNSHKILPRPTWSIFNITQYLKIILKSNQSHWKANTEQEREIRNVVTVQLASRAPRARLVSCTRPGAEPGFKHRGDQV